MKTLFLIKKMGLRQFPEPNQTPTGSFIYLLAYVENRDSDF